MGRQPTGRELSFAKKMEVISRLYKRSTIGKLAHGAINTTASEMNIHRSTVARVWKDFHRDALMPSRKTGRVGRTPIYTPGVVVAMVRELPQSLRTTMREISEATGIPLSTLHRHLKARTLRRRSTRIKPMLNAVFDDMWDVVHPGEKWINADTNVRKDYLTEGEDPEQRSWSSKRFILKVMFLAAVACPRYDTQRGAYFDGKIGMRPIVEYRPAQRNSRNRPAGTIVATLVNGDATVYRNYVVTQVIPAIKAKFPTSNKRIVLQHDNATPHGGVTNKDLVSSSTDGWTFVVRSQPPNSPDLNVLDLGFFASLQTLQHKLTVMRLVLVNNGGNFFRLPHLRKDALRRAGALMSNVSCPVALLA
ncbi:hypothetical protein H310_09515 [Aphanomyces invadans]|uniref:Uncharacterized protein n=1 Tax=Aphanomyces invadans TaxID=157072 RepID=A0A024TUE7_9STRA|nr:hypothetical protein H310_09515 [Aphanomyces invadans]ETV97619.1 hypothetical protein H310_09515 [Aphanomyces invadans]|eukprot:XP_008873828.1 hypothetical protein H310_09515 [Aphanomyces invadans]